MLLRALMMARCGPADDCRSAPEEEFSHLGVARQMIHLGETLVVAAQARLSAQPSVRC